MRSAGLYEALQRLRLVNVEKARTPLGLHHRRPGNDDRPPPTPLADHKVRPIVGQLDIDGNEVETASRLPAA